MEVKMDQTLQYGQMVKRDSSYKYTKIVRNDGGGDLKMSGSTQTTTFEIPVVGFNLAQSSINFNQNFEVAPAVANSFRHTPPWSRVELFTRGGQYLMDVTNFSHVYTAFGQRTKEIEDFHGDDNGIIVKQIPTPTAFGAPAAPASETSGDVPAVNAAMVTVNAAITRLNTVADAVTTSLRSSSELQIKKLAQATNPATLSVRWQISGRELYNTVMSLDKSIIVGEVLNLRITWLEKIAHGFNSDDLVGTTPIALTQDVTITDLGLYLAQETNQAVLNDLSQVISQSGLSVLIPYTHAYKTTLQDTQTSHAVSVRLSRGHGRSLERIYTLFGSGAEEKNTRYDATLENASPVAHGPVSFYSLLDSKRMQEFDISVAAQDYDWTKKLEKKDRAVSLSIGNDQSLFAWSENWCGDDLECAINQHIGGLDLSVERKYDLYVNRLAVGGAGVPLSYYTAAVCQKQLMIGPGGISVM